jgi:hypothetical protein
MSSNSLEVDGVLDHETGHSTHVTVREERDSWGVLAT